MLIDNLILEITRKCNFQCKHCLRGNSQNKNIDFDVMINQYQNKFLADYRNINVYDKI